MGQQDVEMEITNNKRRKLNLICQIYRVNGPSRNGPIRCLGPIQEHDLVCSASHIAWRSSLQAMVLVPLLAICAMAILYFVIVYRS